MRARIMVIVGALVATTLGLAAPSPPAGAAVVVTSTGTSVLAVITGAGGGIDVTCVGGGIRVAGTAATPPVACGSVTSLLIRGDDGGQVVDGSGAGAAVFSSLTLVTYDTRGGQDLVFGSSRPDLVLTGTGNDQVFLDTVGADDSSISLGGNAGDSVTLEATAGADTVDLDTTSGTRTLATSGAWTAALFGAPFVAVAAGDGNDTVDGTGLTASTNIIGTSFQGGQGDDTLRAGTPVATLLGGAGFNHIHGGPAADIVISESRTDAIDGNEGVDQFRDVGEGWVGGRTYDNGTPDDDWQLFVAGDAAIRSVPSVSGLAVVSSNLARTGSQILSPNIGEIAYSTHGAGAPPDRVVLDLRPLTSQSQRVQFTTAQTVVDLVVPTGTWTTTSGVTTFSAGYQPVIVSGATLNVRGPYTDPEERWAHRMLRDLEMRIPTPSERALYRGQVEGGTRTRAQIVASITDADVYRGITVDRAFVDVLRRGTDLGGRAYWIERLRDGLVTRRLRANLYGSPEYVTEQGGGTDPGYVAAAYRDILGRTAAPSEIAYWVDQIVEVGLPRGTVADRFLNTPEARGVVIRDLFLRFAFREPTAGELSTWNTALGSSSTDGEVALVRMLAASTDYFERGA